MRCRLVFHGSVFGSNIIKRIESLLSSLKAASGLSHSSGEELEGNIASGKRLQEISAEHTAEGLASEID